MKQLTIEQIAQMTGGKIFLGNKNIIADNVFIDSRLAKTNGVFFALEGQSTDGHLFIEKAVQGGASIVVLSKECECFGAGAVIVQDTFKALQDMAKAYREQFDIPFVSITGSSGKTTTKELISSVLSQGFNVHKTQGNLNSSTGVPLTLFELKDENEISVIETSMSAKGEILGNADIVRPNTVVITNIGTAHIEFLKSRENIFKAKCELLTYLTAKDTAIVNGDDDMLATLSSDSFEIVKIGINNGDTIAENVLQSSSGVSFDVDGEHFSFDYPGEHNVINCLLAIAVGKKYGLNYEQIQNGLKAFAPIENRMQIDTVKGITLINDAYNANEGSFKAAMDFLCRKAEKRRVVVASDMFELGEFSAELHRKTGENAAKIGVDLLIACGENRENYKNGYLEAGGKDCVIFKDKNELKYNIKKCLNSGDTVLFKASRGVELEEVYNELKEMLHKS